MGEGVLTAGDAAADPPERPAAAFARRGGTLHCEGVPLDRLAAAVGTPFYVYSSATIRERYGRLSAALARVPHRLYYSVKANSNLAVLALLRELGAGVDIVSGGELYRALAAGYAGADVVFSGVGKTAAELCEALDAGVRMINVESEAELRLLDRLAGEREVIAPVAVRVNPEVDVDTPHPYTRTGERGNKFGVPLDEALAVSALADELPNVRLVGLDMHIGSQVTSIEPYRRGVRKLLELYEALRERGARDIRCLDIGGGLAVTYENELESDLADFAATLLPEFERAGLELLMEPGRYLVGNAGALVTRVLYRKRSGGREYAIADAGMTELLRPSHYDAYHRIEVVRGERPRGVLDVVGPVCESGDFLALGREMDDPAPGDLLAVLSAGAYGFVMSSNYNSRPRAPEVLVDGEQWAVVREREPYEDLLRRERARPAWRTF